MNMLEKLRKDGYRVHINHFRNYDLYEILTDESLVRLDQIIPLFDVAVRDVPKVYRKYARAKGGRTEVKITTPDGREFFSEAVCSNKENFNKKLSLKIAVGRILNQL